MSDQQDIRITSKNSTSPVVPEYDAFISYKHSEIDGAAAKALQKSLEHFHVPLVAGLSFPWKPHAGEGTAGKRTGKIRRVFLDEGELSACAAFSSHIREALTHSKWLIIICSPASKQSPWVNMEIEIFLETHDRDHVLAVMTSGEPAENFPEAFLGSGDLPDEMLAADARGDTVREVLKKIRGDVLLRIAAPILEMTYDDLKQRNRIYRLQRFAVMATACLAVVAAFLLYAFIQNRKLDSTNRKLDSANRDLRLRQAEIMTKEASDYLAEGDNLQAVNALLSALPEYGSGPRSGEHPDTVLPAAQYELTKALNLYHSEADSNFREYQLAACSVIRSRDYLENDLLSDESGSFLFAEGNGTIYVWDTSDDHLVREIPFGENIRNWSEEALFDENRIMLCGEHLAVCFQYVTGEILWKTTLPDKIITTARAKLTLPELSTENSEKNVLYILSENIVTVLDTDSGEILSDRRMVLRTPESGPPDIAEDTSSGTEEDAFSDEYYTGTDVSDSDVGSGFFNSSHAVASADGRHLYFISSYNDRGYDYSLYVCNPEGGDVWEVNLLSSDQNVSIVPSSTADGKDDLLFYTCNVQTDSDETVCRLKAVSLKRSESEMEGRVSMQIKQEWESDFPIKTMRAPGDTSFLTIGTAKESVQIVPGFSSSGETPQIIFGCFSHIFRLDPSDGKHLDEWTLPDNITDIEIYRNDSYIMTSVGDYYAYDGEQLLRLTDVFPEGCNDILKLNGQTAFYCLRDNRQIKKYAPLETDQSFVSMNTTMDVVAEEILFENGDWIVMQDYLSLKWISHRNDETHSLTFEEMLQKLSGKEDKTEDKDENNSEEDVDSTDPIIGISQVTPLYLEDDLLWLLYTPSTYTPDGDYRTYFYQLCLNLSDSSLSRKTLFCMDEYFDSSGHLLFDSHSKTLYILKSHTGYTVIRTYEMETGRTKRHTLPIGPSCWFRCLSPDGKKALLAFDLTLYILNLDSWETETSVSLSEYTKNAADNIIDHIPERAFAWDGETLALPDYLKIHVYDADGNEIMTIPCGRAVTDPDSYKYPSITISPDKKYLYY